MPRIYTVSFENVTISAAQDLIGLKGSTGKVCKLRRAWLGASNTTLQTAQSLRLNVKYGSATVTLGSGGSSPTPRPVDPGDSAASFTAVANATTPSTTSGAFVNIEPDGIHNYAGEKLAWPEAEAPTFGLNEGVIFELLSTVTGTCAFSGGVAVSESGS